MGTNERRPTWLVKEGELTEEEARIVRALGAAIEMVNLHDLVQQNLPERRVPRGAGSDHPLWDEEANILRPMWDMAYHAIEVGLTDEDALIRAGVLDEMVGMAISLEEWKETRGY